MEQSVLLDWGNVETYKDTVIPGTHAMNNTLTVLAIPGTPQEDQG